MGDTFVMRASRQLLSDIDDLVGEVADAVQAAGLYNDSDVTAADLRAAHRANLAGLLGFLSGDPQAGLSAPQATGRLRGGQGTPLPTVLRAYRIGASVIWDRMVALAGDDDAAKAEMLTKASLAWQIFDEYTQAVTVSYQEAIGEQARRDAAIRDAALDALFGGPLAGGRLWDCATTLRLPQHGTFVVVVAALPDAAVEDGLPGVEAGLTALGVRSAWRLQLGSRVGVVSLTDTFTVERLGAMIADRGVPAVGISTAYDGLEDTYIALRQAQLACAAAGSAANRVLRYEEALVPALIAGAPEVAAALTAAVLGPLLDLPASDRDVLLETLRCWFDAGGEVSAVAEALYCHRNTVRSRLNRIAELSGCDVTSPLGAAHLYLALQAHRIARYRWAADLLSAPRNPMEPNPPDHSPTT